MIVNGIIQFSSRTVIIRSFGQTASSPACWSKVTAAHFTCIRSRMECNITRSLLFDIWIVFHDKKFLHCEISRMTDIEHQTLYANYDEEVNCETKCHRIVGLG